MKIFWAILSCILLWYFWIRLVQNIFAKHQKRMSLKLFLTCFVLVWSLLSFTYLLKAILPEYKAIEDGVISLNWEWVFLLYCWLIFLFLILINKNRAKKQIWFLFMTWILLFAVTWIFWMKIWISASVLYYFILAYAEEFLKIWATENEVSKTWFYTSDILFFSVFIALWFSIVENLFYLWFEIFSSNQDWVLSLVFWRWIFTSLLHFIATWTIALLLYKLYQQHHLKDLNLFNKIWRIIVAILIWVLIHWWYNLAIQWSSLWIYIVLVIGWYFLLTYILFLSDQLYMKDK